MYLKSLNLTRKRKIRRPPSVMQLVYLKIFLGIKIRLTSKKNIESKAFGQMYYSHQNEHIMFIKIVVARYI